MVSIARIYRYQTGNQDNLNLRPNIQSASIIVINEREDPTDTYCTSECSNTAVRDYLTAMIKVDEVEKPLLLQITYAMKRVHESGNTLRQDAFSMDNIRFSQNGKELVWIVQFRDIEEATEDERSRNIGWLADMFESIFRQVNRLNTTSNHLLTEMRHGYSSADSVLTHPYFWTCLKKVNFVCSVNHICSLVLGSGKQGVTLESEFSGWKENLKAECPRTGNPDLDAVRKLLEFSEKNFGIHSENGSGLLRFFRNCARHYWDGKAVNKRARKVFKTEYDGFWKFFDEQFPKLLVATFDWAREDERPRERVNLYLTELSPTNEIIAMPEDAENV